MLTAENLRLFLILVLVKPFNIVAPLAKIPCDSFRRPAVVTNIEDSVLLSAGPILLYTAAFVIKGLPELMCVLTASNAAHPTT